MAFPKVSPSDADYYVGVMDIWVEGDSRKNTLRLRAPHLNVDIACPANKVTQGAQKLSALVPAFNSKKGSQRGYVCTAELLELFKMMQEEPDLLAKIVAVTEAHIALKGGK